MHYNQGADLFTYMKNAEVFDVKDGMIDLLTGPGLGIDVDEALIRKNAEENKGFSWRNPTWRTSFCSVLVFIQRRRADLDVFLSRRWTRRRYPRVVGFVLLRLR
jgi:hypothetical protein